VAITAPCAYVTPWAAVVIGGIAGVWVVAACLFLERVIKVDDPVGAIGVHGANGAWGVLALGLFADGTYNAGVNNSYWYKLPSGSLEWHAEKLKDLPDGWAEQGVTGLLYGNPSQFLAQCIGVGANIVWVFGTAFVFFYVLEKILGNRVSAAVELQGLDVPEMGVLGYISDAPSVPEGHVMHPSMMEPRPALVPPIGGKRFSITVTGLDTTTLTGIWSELCQPRESPPSSEFLKVYPHMTTLEGTRFRFRSGDPKEISSALSRLLSAQSGNQQVRVLLEGA
jgi:Amt family ammonium transporter